MRNGHCGGIRLHRHGDRHKDREIGSGEQKRKNSSYLPIVWSLWLVGLLWLSGLSGVCWFRFLTSHKKIF